MDVQVRDIERTIGAIRISIAADDTITMNAADLIAVIGDLIGSSTRNAIERAADGDGNVTLSQVNDAGLPLSFDSLKFELKLELSLDGRVSTEIALTTRAEQLASDYRKPDDFSFYMNYAVALDYIHRGVDQGDVAPVGDLDAAMRLYGFVLESEFTYNELNRDAFSREGTRLVYDWEGEAIRFTIGDDRTAFRSFMGSQDILGISISRLYSAIQPGRNLRPRGSSSFTLDQTSNVEVIVNGLEANRLRLPAGSYNLADFPFASGSNDVQIIVENATGRTEVVNFSLFFDDQLLDPGLFEFSVSYGAYSTLDQGVRVYDEDRWIASGFARIGIAEFLTAGVYGQANENARLYGGEMLLSSVLGTLALDGAYSDNDAAGTGWIGRASLQRRFEIFNPDDLTIVLSAEHRSENFAQIDDVVTTQVVDMTYAASFGYRLSDDVSVFGGGRYTTYRDGSEDVWGINAGATWRISDTLTFRVAGTADRDRSGDMEYNVGLRLAARLSADTFASASYNTRAQRADLAWSRTPGIRSDAWEADAMLSYAAGESVEFTGGLGYASNRGAIRLEHNSAYDIDGSTVADSRTSLRAEGAIAFSGGSFAVGRRIADSFAVISRDETLDVSDVLINPDGEDYSAKVDEFGPALLADLTGYLPAEIEYVVPDAPPFYDLGQSNFRVKPAYRSGFSMTVGSPYSLTVTGIAVDAGGRPLALMSGTARSLDDQAAPTLDVFTNATGRFALSGAGAGRWELTLSDGRATRQFTVEIAPSPDGLVQLGTIEVR